MIVYKCINTNCYGKFCELTRNLARSKIWKSRKPWKSQKKQLNKVIEILPLRIKTGKHKSEFDKV